MTAYVPSGLTEASWITSILAANLLWGFSLSRMPTTLARILAWTTAVVGVLGVHTLLLEEAAGFRMLALIAVSLLSMKAVVVVEAQSQGMQPLSFSRWVGFAVAWVGMRPALFAEMKSSAVPGGRQLMLKGMTRIFCGALLVYAAVWTSREFEIYWLTVFLLMTGISLIMHFGICNLMASAWRHFGVEANVLFRAPLYSQNLSEFWGRRWNLAFSEMTSIAIYRPLAGRLGRGGALLSAFLVSGLLHEMAITLPVQAGFGLPLLYFAIHGLLVSLERALASRQFEIHGGWGRAWTIFWVVAPLPILFHQPFLNQVVLPIIGAQVRG